MKNAVAVDKATAAQETFDRWFNRAGHWIYRDRAHAMSVWMTRGIDGLPPYAGAR